MKRWLLLLLWLGSSLASAASLDSLWDYDQPAQSEERFRAALERSSDPSERGELLSQIARAMGLQEKFDGANLVLDDLQAELGQLSPTVSVRYLLERGRLILSGGDAKKSQRWFRNAMLLAQRNQLDFYAIDAMHMLALSEQGKPALDWNFKALQLAEATADARAADWRGSLYNNIGWAYHDQKNYPKALDYLRRALSFHETKGDLKPLLIARWSVAKLLRLSSEQEKALIQQLDLERAWNKLGQPHGYVYEEIAENLFELRRMDEAKAYFAKAYALLSQDAWLNKSEAGRLSRMKMLAQ